MDKKPPQLGKAFGYYHPKKFKPLLQNFVGDPHKKIGHLNLKQALNLKN